MKWPPDLSVPPYAQEKEQMIGGASNEVAQIPLDVHRAASPWALFCMDSFE